MKRTLSARDGTRAGVLARVVAHSLVVGDAAELLGVSYRQAKQDFVVQYQHQALQLTPPHARFRVSPQSRVLVRETADGTLRVLQVDARGGEHELKWRPAPPRLPKPPAVPPPTVAGARAPTPPAANHPWRRQFTAWVAARQASGVGVAAGHPEPRGHF